MCESWLGAMGAPSSAQSCDRTSRLGFKAIADVQLQPDKRHMIGGKTTESMPKRKAIVDLFMNLFRTIWFPPQLPVLSPEKRVLTIPWSTLLSRAQREA